MGDVVSLFKEYVQDPISLGAQRIEIPNKHVNDIFNYLREANFRYDLIEEDVGVEFSYNIPTVCSFIVVDKNWQMFGV